LDVGADPVHAQGHDQDTDLNLVGRSDNQVGEVSASGPAPRRYYD
jgi:hypothetical protein